MNPRLLPELWPGLYRSLLDAVERAERNGQKNVEAVRKPPERLLAVQNLAPVEYADKTA
jgi:hypothetical protein